MRILLAYRDNADLSAAEIMLRLDGHELSVMKDPEMAAEITCFTGFDIVITDFDLKGFNAFEIIWKTRSRVADPVVIQHKQGALLRVRDIGFANWFLQTPYSSSVLMKMIDFEISRKKESILAKMLLANN